MNLTTLRPYGAYPVGFSARLLNETPEQKRSRIADRLLARGSKHKAICELPNASIVLSKTPFPPGSTTLFRLPQAPIPNFYKMGRRLYRSGQPDWGNSSVIPFVQALGIRTVINANNDDDDVSSRSRLQNVLAQAGISQVFVNTDNLHHHLVDLRSTLSPETLRSSAVLIHCLKGEKRTGMIAALAREISGWGHDEIKKEAKLFGANDLVINSVLGLLPKK